MNETEYSAVLNDLFRAVGEFGDPDLLQSVVLASTDGQTGRLRTMRALQALQREFDTRSNRVELVLSRLNEVVGTSGGGPVDGISVLVGEEDEEPGPSVVDVTAEGRQLAEVVELLSDLIGDVEADDDLE